MNNKINAKKRSSQVDNLTLKRRKERTMEEKNEVRRKGRKEEKMSRGRMKEEGKKKRTNE